MCGIMGCGVCNLLNVTHWEIDALMLLRMMMWKGVRNLLDSEGSEEFISNTPPTSFENKRGEGMIYASPEQITMSKQAGRGILSHDDHSKISHEVHYYTYYLFKVQFSVSDFLKTLYERLNVSFWKSVVFTHSDRVSK